MTERALRNTFVVGTIVSLAALGMMTWDSLSQVTSLRTAPLSADVVAGKKIFQAKNCNDCHTILGIGGYYAPELTKVTQRRDTAWLRRWLVDPRAVSPAATMPNQHLSDAQAAQVVAFMQWVGSINTNNWPPAPRLRLGGGTEVSGAVLFQTKGCSACHRIGDVGEGEPDLSHIGSVPYDGLANTPEFLKVWLDNPEAVKRNTTMPRVPLTPAERDALVQYLTSLK